LAKPTRYSAIAFVLPDPRGILEISAKKRKTDSADPFKFIIGASSTKDSSE
jgi:hypothetical protein